MKISGFKEKTFSLKQRLNLLFILLKIHNFEPWKLSCFNFFFGPRN